MLDWKAFEVSARVVRTNSTLYIHLSKEFCKRHDIQEGDRVDLIAHAVLREHNYRDLVYIPEVVAKGN